MSFNEPSERRHSLRRYHHIGIPTDEPREGERYDQDLKFYSSGYESSPYGIEWMRFEAS